MNILVIGPDSCWAHDFLRRALGEAHTIEWAGSYEGAAQRYQPDAYDLVYLDISTAKGNEWIKTLGRLVGRGLQVVVVDTQLNLHDCFIIWHAGAVHYASKLLDARSLREDFEIALEKVPA